jgi:hypothetical protein
VDAASDQVDTVRAAQAAGIPVAAAIASWDNLTNKGLMRVDPDLVTVWNAIQKDEAVTLHGIEPDRVAVTGAQLFDRWFDRAPALDRAAFCRQVGLPGEAPFLLFTGSSVFIARSELEVRFVRGWIGALRASDDSRLRSMPVLVRPHPFNSDAWAAADFADLGPVAVWPRRQYTPAAEDARSSLFDSLYHSIAVVGINTSAMIEAAILLKPVFSILAPEFAGTQEGTIHFRYLLPEHGGFLRVAGSLDEHLQQLGTALDAVEADRARTERFVHTFLRPHGATLACTPILAGRLVQLAGQGGRAAAPVSVGDRLLRGVLVPAAVLVAIADRWEDLPGLARRRVNRVRAVLHRTWQIGLKRMVIRPVRRTIGAGAIAAKRTRWAARTGRKHLGLAAASLGDGALRVVKRVRGTLRLARYHVAVLVRRDPS